MKTPLVIERSTTAPVMQQAMDDTVVTLKNVSNAFGPNVVHKDLNLQIQTGEILALIGGSGAGKSVLLRSILGLRAPQAGDIHVLGKSIVHSSESELYEVRKRWGVLFQDGALFSSLSVLENIKVPLRQYTKLSDDILDDIALSKLIMVGLPVEAGAKFPKELSGGMRKRAGLARALALDPMVLFLDEPTAGLDPVGANDFDLLIKGLQKTLRLTVVMITHDLDSLYAITDRVAVLAEKRIYAIGAIAELIDNKYPWIQEYFNGPRGRSASKA